MTIYDIQLLAYIKPVLYHERDHPGGHWWDVKATASTIHRIICWPTRVRASLAVLLSTELTAEFPRVPENNFGHVKKKSSSGGYQNKCRLFVSWLRFKDQSSGFKVSSWKKNSRHFATISLIGWRWYNRHARSFVLHALMPKRAV